MRRKSVLLLLVAGLTIGAAGCKRQTVDKMVLESAINGYLGSHPDCLWTAPVKFPVQADTADDEQTKGFDALTDAGMLTRTPHEKKRFLIGSKQVNDYDISPKGRSEWKPDPSQPGYGNFCFGHLAVSNIDSYAPNDESNPTQYTASYHYNVQGIPGWANTAEMQTAFPKIVHDASAPQSATATLTKTASGWQVVNNQPTPSTQ